MADMLIMACATITYILALCNLQYTVRTKVNLIYMKTNVLLLSLFSVVSNCSLFDASLVATIPLLVQLANCTNVYFYTV